jgi:GT2 family glycosyltransferase
METEISAARMGIVVVNYGSHRLIEANLGSIDLSRLDVQVVIVDNFSSLEERSAIEHVASSRSWSLVNLARNEGFGAGANAGLRVAADAGCASFLVLNPDADVQVEVVDELQQHCLRDRYALVTPILVTSAGEIAFDGSQVYLDTGRIKRVRRPDGAGSRGEVISDRLLGDGRPARAWLPGTCLALHRDLLSKAGGFHEPYFLYWEDLDLSYRCQDVGGSLVIRHDLAVVHDEGGTQQRPGGRALSQRYYYWNCRNRLLFAARHLPTRQVVRWMLHTPAESWQIVLRGGRRQLLHSPAPLVAAVRGSLAGLMIAACAVFGRRPSIRSYPVI